MPLISDYLEYRRPSWSPTTYKSERSRLKCVANKLDWEPMKLYEYLRARPMKPYSIKELFLRLSDFTDWIPGTEVNKYRVFMKRNRQVFKRAYQRIQIAVDYQEAVDRIKTIPYAAVRNHALFLLNSGLRISESYEVQEAEDGSCFVIGKGGYRRTVFGRPPQRGNLLSQTGFRNQLARIGLRPHDLRRIFATKLVRSGMDLHDVCRVMGWRSITTAMNYLQNSSDEILASKIKEVTSG